MKPQVVERLSASGVVDTIGAARFFPTVRAAVTACLETDAVAAATPV
jgi:hypothetical protein